MTTRELQAEKKKKMSVVVCGKGGSGKSSTAASIHIASTMWPLKTGALTTDINNADLHRVGLAPEPIDLREEANIGRIWMLMDQLKNGEIEHALLDTAAGQADLINSYLPEWSQVLAGFGASLVVVKPVTLNVYTQAEALAWNNDEREPQMASIIVRNLGQGRRPEHFKRWDQSSKRLALLQSGVIEVDMESMSASVAENALNFRMTILDVAKGNFGRAGTFETDARELFDAGVQRFCAQWIAKHTERFAKAYDDAIANASKTTL